MFTMKVMLMSLVFIIFVTIGVYVLKNLTIEKIKC